MSQLLPVWIRRVVEECIQAGQVLDLLPGLLSPPFAMGGTEHEAIQMPRRINLSEGHVFRGSGDAFPDPQRQDSVAPMQFQMDQVMGNRMIGTGFFLDSKVVEIGRDLGREDGEARGILRALHEVGLARTSRTDGIAETHIGLGFGEEEGVDGNHFLPRFSQGGIDLREHLFDGLEHGLGLFGAEIGIEEHATIRRLIGVQSIVFVLHEGPNRGPDGFGFPLDALIDGLHSRCGIQARAKGLPLRQCEADSA